MTDPASLRVADADREALIEELREHMLAGRLTSSEFEERLDLAYKATTRGDLDALSVDLPVSPAVVKRSLAQRRAHLRRRLVQEAGGSATASVVCVAIWLASGASGSFWPIWVILFTLLPVLRDGWSLLGPAPDEESVERRLEARRARRLDHGPSGRRSRRHHRELPR
ncbi:MAG TPA: DUF1707 domain-containing protein [Solirubrobacteraceae bacterium]|jgi:hypothetical protein